MYDEMKQLLINRGTYDEQSFRILYQYNYYGAVGVIRDWVDRGCQESPEEFGNILYGIVETFVEIINDYIIWYNTKRIKASLGYLSPMEYRQSLGLI